MGLHEKQPELQGIKYTFSWIEDSLLEFKKNILPFLERKFFLEEIILDVLLLICYIQKKKLGSKQ